MDHLNESEQTVLKQTDLISKLKNIVGEDYVLTDYESRQFYSMDFSEEVSPIAIAVVRPQTVEQISQIVISAKEHQAINHLTPPRGSLTSPWYLGIKCM